MDYSVRTYRPGDVEGIVALLEDVYGGWPPFDLSCSPIDHWRWKFLDNPLRMNAVVVVEAGGRIIGCDHNVYFELKLGGRIVPGRRGLFLAIHPDFRGRGFYSKMDELKREVIGSLPPSLSFWLSTNPIVISRALKEGRLPFPRPIVRLIRIKDFDLHIKLGKPRKALLKKYGFMLLKAWNRLRWVFIRTSNTHENGNRIIVSDVDGFDERFDSFWNRIKDRYKFIAVRDRKNLNWRYHDKRGGEFIVKQAERNGILVGFSVLRINRLKGDYPIGYIVDLLVDSDHLDAADALIEASKKYFDEHGVNVVHFMAVKDHPHVVLFLGHGFVKNRMKNQVFVNKESFEDDWKALAAASPGELHFNFGDTDII